MALATGPAAEPPPAPTHPRVAVRHALREFDRFLDHHPLLEDELRLRPTAAQDEAYLRENPELQAFLVANPTVREGLRLYPRYYLFRALLRQANAPLRYAEIAQLRGGFDQDPGLEQALVLPPEAIRDPNFLVTHPGLHDCLARHPALDRVFRPSL